MQWFIQETQGRAQQWTDVFRDHDAVVSFINRMGRLGLSMTLKFLHKRRLVSVFCRLCYYLKTNFTYKLIKPTFIKYSALCSATGESKIRPQGMHLLGKKTKKAILQFLKNVFGIF